MATTQRNGTGVSAEFAQKNANTPAAASDIANKAYVDAVATGLSPKTSVVAASAAALPSYSYANGVAGVGATITKSTPGALTLDGVTGFTVGDRVLIKDETGGNAPYNGIYIVTVPGGVAAFVLTRATDNDQATEFSGSFVFCESGTVNTGAGFVCTNTGSVVVGTTPITWTQFSGAGEIVAGAGLTKTGNTLDVGAGDGIQADADSVTVKLDGGTLSKSAAGIKVVSGVGGLSAADTWLDLPFFRNYSLIPPTTYREDLYAYPGRDFENLNSGVLAVNRGVARYSGGSGGQIGNWGWNLGGLKTRILFLTTVTVGLGSDYSIFIANTIPTSSEVANGTYLINVTTTSVTLFKRTGGSFISLGSEAGLAIGTSPIAAELGVGIYYNDTTNQLIVFIRKGPGQWMVAIDITDTTFTTMQYAGIRTGGVSQIYWANTPLALYYET